MTDAATRAVIEASLERCRQVADGVEEVRPDLVDVLPASSIAEVKAIRSASIASVALLKRVEQLQDLLARLMRALVAWEGGDAQAMTVRDLANWMEKRDQLVASEWMEVTRLRNRLVHEYPIDAAEQLERVNESWAATATLEQVLASLEQWWTARSGEADAP